IGDVARCLPRKSPNLGYGRKPRSPMRFRHPHHDPHPTAEGAHTMLKRIRQRLDGNTEQGFTLIELLVVIIIIGILLAIAVPSYLSFRDRASNNAAKANLLAALPSAEAYYADNGTYVGMTPAALKLIDNGVSPT